MPDLGNLFLLLLWFAVVLGVLFTLEGIGRIADKIVGVIARKRQRNALVTYCRITPNEAFIEFTGGRDHA